MLSKQVKTAKNLFFFNKKLNSVQNQFLFSSKNLKALCSDPIDPICRQTFEKNGWEVTELPKSVSEEELLQIIGEYNALVVRSGTTVTEKIIAAGQKLKFIGRAGSGVDNINLQAATNNGILVMNTPGGNTVSTAEHTMALMMSLSRNIPQGDASLKEGKWARKQYSGVELQGKTIGIIGLGKIGQYIGKWCQAFEMNVIAFDPVLSPEHVQDLGIQAVTIEELYQRSDYITVHTPLNNHTRNLLNKNTIAQCKDGVRLINCARGGIINEEDLLEALDSGKVAGAALDVFTKEPLQDLQMKLVNHPKVISTPHLGASTDEAQIKVAKNIAQQIADAYLGTRLFGVVNSPKGYQHVTNPKYIPYINLGEKLGQIMEPVIPTLQILNKIELTFFGNFLKEASPIIRASMIKGYLNKFLDEEPLNLLNAESKAQSLGLHINTTYVENQHIITDNAIEIKCIYNENGQEVSKSILGSVYQQDKKPFLIKVDDNEIFLPLMGNILFYQNIDKPGILSETTNILTQHNINIENLFLGRQQKGNLALTGFQLESTISEEVLQQIKQIDTVSNVQQISLSNNMKFKFSSIPTRKPNNPNFSSGPCSKHPEYDLVQLSKKDSMKVLGRSHRSKLGKSRIQHALQKSKEILGLPEDYQVGLVPASDTGAMEMAMWSMLGPRPVDVAYWESFGKGWFQDVNTHLKLQVQNIGTDEYGTIPDLSKVRPEHDLVFAYNGTTSGVRVPNLDFISENREGITIADCTSAVFAQDIKPYSKLDVMTYSWQKVLGGEGGHGIMILSPRAVERLESYTPSWPLPKIFRMTKKGKLDKALFQHSPINTPSMLCIEDYIDSLEWIERIGGLPAAQQKCDDNLKVIEHFINNQKSDWIQFLVQDPTIRSNTSVCLKLDATSEQIKKINTLLENEGVAFDINGYKDAPPSLRIWCGATVQARDLELCLEWVKYAYDRVLSE